MTLEVSSLYLSCHNDLLGYLRHLLHCQETAEDIAQEAFIAVAQSARQVTIANPRGFLFRTAGNLAIDHIRHHQVIARHAEQEQSCDETLLQSSPEQEITQAERLALLHRAIAALPPRTRDVFVLNKLHDFSYKQIAALLGISESAVEKHICRGLKHCRVELGTYFNHMP